jgi:hypothetical protein
MLSISGQSARFRADGLAEATAARAATTMVEKCMLAVGFGVVLV